MAGRQVLITKEGGEQEAFESDKLVQSLLRAGVTPKTAKTISVDIRKTIRPGATTSDIYRKAFGNLRKLERHAAARYSLRRALQDLGPSGFPFEDFVGEIFRAKGFTVETGIMLQGSCVEHEVDLVAHNNRTYLVGEVKFHNEPGLRSDLKVALYVASRVEDLRKFRHERGERPIDEGWLITNTKFTKSAITYANCRGLKIVGWTYPRVGNLQDLIEETRLHPITCLTTLSRPEKDILIGQGVVLCRSIEENQVAFMKAGIKGDKLKRVLEEGRQLCLPS